MAHRSDFEEKKDLSIESRAARKLLGSFLSKSVFTCLRRRSNFICQVMSSANFCPADIACLILLHAEFLLAQRHTVFSEIPNKAKHDLSTTSRAG